MDDDRKRDAWEQLLTIVRLQGDATDCWKRAENVLRADLLRSRLDEIAINITPDIAASLMAAAMLLASTSDEWGGDYRDALADLAAIGLELIDS